MRIPAETERNEATLADTPRACLFREAKPALLALGISDSRTGGLIVQWMKVTNETDQLVLAFLESCRAGHVSGGKYHRIAHRSPMYKAAAIATLSAKVLI